MLVILFEHPFFTDSPTVYTSAKSGRIIFKWFAAHVYDLKTFIFLGLIVPNTQQAVQRFLQKIYQHLFCILLTPIFQNSFFDVLFISLASSANSKKMSYSNFFTVGCKELILHFAKSSIRILRFFLFFFVDRLQ